MNSKLRSCLAWSLVGDLSLTNLWVNARCNPADYPSRNKEIPKPASANLPDALLSEHVIKGSQISRSIGEQVLFEQEAQLHDFDPVLQSPFGAVSSEQSGEQSSVPFRRIVKMDLLQSCGFVRSSQAAQACLHP